MITFNLSKAFCCFSDQINSTFFFSNLQTAQSSSYILVQIASGNSPIPLKAFKFILSIGIVIFTIFLTTLVIYVLLKWYNLKWYFTTIIYAFFFSFIVIPAFLYLFKTMWVFFFNLLFIWNKVLAVLIPYGILLNFNKPISVFIVVTYVNLLSFRIWWYAVFNLFL